MFLKSVLLFALTVSLASRSVNENLVEQEIIFYYERNVQYTRMIKSSDTVDDCIKGLQLEHDSNMNATDKNQILAINACFLEEDELIDITFNGQDILLEIYNQYKKQGKEMHLRLVCIYNDHE